MKKIMSVTIIVLFFLLEINTSSNDSNNSDNCSLNHLLENHIEHIKLNSNDDEIRLLIILPQGHGTNFHLEKNLFDLFGWNVTIAGITQYVNPCGGAQQAYGAPTIKVDVLISDISDISLFDCIFIASASYWYGDGNPCGELMSSSHLLDLLQEAHNQRKIIAARCSGVRVLAAAGVISERNVSGHPAFESEYEAAGAQFLGRSVPPVIDGNIVTFTVGDYYCINNCQAIASAIESNANIERCNTLKDDKIQLESRTFGNKNEGCWIKVFGGEQAEGAWSVIETHDNCFVLVGYTYSFDASNSDILLMKINTDGNEMWSKTYGGFGWECGYSVCEDTSGCLIITGYTTSMGNGARDIYLLKTDANGDVIWEQTFGGPAVDIGRWVDVTGNNDIIVCGSTESFGSGIDDIYVIKTDKDGTLIWNDVFGDEESNWADSVIVTDDERIIVLATTGDWFDKPEGFGNRDVCLIQLETNGDLLSTKVIGDPQNYNQGAKILLTNDGGYIIAGEGDILHRNTREVYVLKTDASGNELWSDLIGEGTFYEFGRSVCLVDNEYHLCGYAKTKESPCCETDVYLLKMNVFGEVIYKKTFGGFGSDWALSMCSTDDNDLVIVGQTNSFRDGSFDILIIKTDRQGNFNYPPDKPDAPEGPLTGRIRTDIEYIVQAYDPDGDDVFYLIDWGDNTNSDWIGPFQSGEEVTIMKSWNQQGNYNIKVKAKDILGAESEWSDPLEISMPRNRLFVDQLYRFFYCLKREIIQIAIPDNK